MKDFVSNILPRIVQYSKSLNEKERLVEKPWGMIDLSGNRLQFIFLRNGRLIRSINGIVTEGYWEYISSVNSLIIDIDDEKIMMKHLFFNDHALVLSLDDFSKKYLMLANENYIPDLKVQKYLQKLAPSNKIHQILLRDGSIIDLEGQDEKILRKGSFLSQNGMPLNGTYITRNNLHLILSNGFLKNVFYRKSISSLSYDFEIVSREKESIQIGDAVMKDSTFLPDGIFRINKDQLIEVKGGVIKEIKHQTLELRKLNYSERNQTPNHESNYNEPDDETGMKPEYIVAMVALLLVIILIKCNS